MSVTVYSISVMAVQTAVIVHSSVQNVEGK